MENGNPIKGLGRVKERERERERERESLDWGLRDGTNERIEKGVQSQKPKDRVSSTVLLQCLTRRTHIKIICRNQDI